MVDQQLLSLKNGLTDAMFEKEFDVSVRSDKVPHAPVRRPNLSSQDTRQALSNALRYVPAKFHQKMAKELALELQLYGHIYMYRLRPTEYEMKAYPLSSYPCKSKQAAAVMLMITNNLDPAVAQHPHELITYGGNGSVFSNWAQYHLVMKYLSEMQEDQTLHVYSGHPMGLFPSHKDAPRVVVTNGMMVPFYSTREQYERLYAMGLTQYGNMTAGSYCYIGPQGIVHGTNITLINAGRKFLNAKCMDDLRGKVFVSAGLGGMSGAQPKAAFMAGLVCVIAEIDPAALDKRHKQGWIMRKESDLAKVVQLIKEYSAKKEPISIGYLGNIVDLWEYLAKAEDVHVDLGSDQTSLHNPYSGGYYPVGVSFDDSRRLMVEDPDNFKLKVQESLRRHVSAVNKLSARGMKFWDYGNAFLLESSRAGADIWKAEEGGAFRYASYFEDFMGDIFSLGFGPYRWVCTSGDHEDLKTTDRIAAEVIQKLINLSGVDHRVKGQLQDNLNWIQQCEQHQLVVGSQARILYSNADGRIQMAEAFNQAVKDGRLRGPVMLSRDHHDVSGTDSPFRETSNITDGSKVCADMAIHNVLGDAFRGATSVSIHNGGGTGWGMAMNGGFLLLLDGSDDAVRRARAMLHFDVNNGVARRCWSGNSNAEFQIQEAMKSDSRLNITIPYHADDSLIESVLSEVQKADQGKRQSRQVQFKSQNKKLKQ
ncbi:hypothetical protein MIR68_002953 [Amoeboaphelidium protococcarum]|nr:hypothetical protein MIR68_002953 [Amoeboaphelidium protococcarum]